MDRRAAAGGRVKNEQESVRTSESESVGEELSPEVW